MKHKLLILHKTRNHILVLCLFCTLHIANAEDKVTRYTVNDGLSQHAVTSIVQGNDNMLWIGTFDGLNVFDGKEFRTFRHVSGESSSLSNNRILALACDDREGLWALLTNNFVAKYDRDGAFFNYNLNPQKSEDLGNEIRTMDICDGYLLISNRPFGIRLFKINDSPDTERIKKFKLFIEEKENEFIVSFDFSHDRIWISTLKGVYCSDTDYNFNKVSNHEGYFLKTSSTSSTVYLWKGAAIMICTTVDTMQGIVFDKVTEYAMTSDILAAECGYNGEDWVGTETGVYKIADNKVLGYSSQMPMRALYMDNMGVMWCGGRGGLISINPYEQPVHNLKFTDSDFAPNNNIYSVVKGQDDEHIWCSTFRKGLMQLSYKTVSENEKTFDYCGDFFRQNKITMCESYSKDTVIVGTDDGLKMLIKHKGEYCETDIMSNKIFTGEPFRSVKTGNGLLIGNSSKLFSLKFSKGNPTISELTSINSKLPRYSITTMAISHRFQTLIVGYRGGSDIQIVSLRDSTVHSFKEYTGLCLPNNYIWDIFIDSHDRVWIGTDAGLYSIDKLPNGKYNLRALTSKDGLKNDKFVSIEEDGEGKIWAGTSQGIICLNPSTGKFKTYDSKDGFSSNNFTEASCRLSDGTLVFGSTNGLSYFQSKEFITITASPKLWINKIKYGNRSVSSDKLDNFKLSNRGEEIFIYLSTYYSPNPTEIRYEYSINGRQWIQTHSNVIILSNLTAGKHTIQIRAVSKEAASEIQTLSITTKRPPLQSTFAKCVYLVVLAFAIFTFFRNYARRKITKKKRLLEKEMEENEKHRTSEMLNFYINMAHEIKTPLTLILGRLYDIENSGESSPYILNKSKLIKENINIIKELTDQILEYRKILSANTKLDTQKVDIMPDIIKIVDNYSDYAFQKGIKLKMETSSREIIMNIDLKKLTRILYNLISNSIKYSKAGDSILVKIIKKPDSLTVTVADTGCGISEEDLPHIFERFYKAGKASGTGIGLAFTKTIVDMFNGTIQVSSKIGEGTTFLVTIPNQTIEQTENPDYGKNLILDRHDANIPVILLVENDIELSEYIKEFLSVNYLVICAYDGKEALKIIQNRQIDLILSDVMMEDVDGIELARKIKGIKAYSHIPIIFLSARTDPDDILRGLQSGAIDYITKPFSPDILLNKIQNILSQYWLSKENFDKMSIPVTSYVTVQNTDEIFINKARGIIYENLSEETFCVNVLAEKMGISRVHLNREFQRILNISPSNYIKSVRLNEGKRLLENGETSVKEVLFKIGLRSHSGFTKAFKEEFGYVPSQLVREQKLHDSIE